MENRVKILIADGNEEFCAHVKRRLEQVSGYEIVGPPPTVSAQSS